MPKRETVDGVRKLRGLQIIKKNISSKKVRKNSRTTPR